MEAHIVLQSNDKLIIWQGNPLDSAHEAFKEAKLKLGMIAELFETYYKPLYVHQLYSSGHVYQNNFSKNCKPIMHLELGLLAGMQADNGEPCIQVFREENYANPEVVTSMQLVVYKCKYPDKPIQKSMFQLEAEVELRAGGSSSHVSLLSPKPSPPKEVALVLNLQFSNYSEMITLAMLIESKIDEMQKRKNAQQRSEDDFNFWNNCKMYGHMLTRQVEFWKFNSITEEQFLANVDTGDILLFRSESHRIFG